MVTMQDIVNDIRRIDDECFSFLSPDEKFMIVIFRPCKERAVRSYVKKSDLHYEFDERGWLRIPIRKIKDSGKPSSSVKRHS